jgi:hypothetical protein
MPIRPAAFRPPFTEGLALSGKRPLPAVKDNPFHPSLFRHYSPLKHLMLKQGAGQFNYIDGVYCEKL